jgi:hypothetical protein
MPEVLKLVNDKKGTVSFESKDKGKCKILRHYDYEGALLFIMNVRCLHVAIDVYRASCCVLLISSILALF